jgi:hypothetical protein
VSRTKRQDLAENHSENSGELRAEWRHVPDCRGLDQNMGLALAIARKAACARPTVADASVRWPLDAQGFWCEWTDTVAYTREKN